MKKKIYTIIVLFFFAIYLICFQSCKKNSIPSNTNNNPKSKVTVYTNGNDPRLAQIETSNQRFVFFGIRNPGGSPSHLIGYTAYSLTDSTQFDLATYGSLSRFSTFLLRRGKRRHVDYLLNDSMRITVGGKDNVIKQVTTLRASAEKGVSKIARSLKIDLINGYNVTDHNAAGFVDERKANGTRLDLLSIFKKMKDSVEFHIVGSEKDQFEPRQVKLAKERLGKYGVDIRVIPGGHMITYEQPKLLTEIILELSK